jgi:tape measure domain-containing protein
VSGASAQESGSAMMQLGQALASGVLQGDELRSVLEAMPSLAEALARELGVSIGELRKLGSEGKLTADTVFPALLRATERLGGALADAPLSLNRAFGQLSVATTGFLEQLDRAVGLSARLAQGLSGAAAGLNGFRQGAGLLTDAERLAQMRSRAEALDAAIGRAEAGSLPAAPRRGTVQQGLTGVAAGQAGATPAGDLAQMRAEYLALRAEIDTAERDAVTRSIAEAEAGDRTRADNARRSAQGELTTLRETLDRREVITREAAERRALIERGVATGAQTPEQAAVLRAQVDQRERDDLAKLGQGGRSGAAAPATTRAGEGLARVAEENDRARESFDRLMGSLDPAQAAMQQYAQAHDTITTAMARGLITEEEFRVAVDRSRDALGQRLQRAQEDADGTTEAQKRVADGARSLGLSFTSAFEDAIVEGKALGDVLKGLEKDLARIILRKAITEPLAGAAASGISGAFSAAFSSGGAAATPAISASANGFLFHTGGIAGHDAAPGRRVAASIFASAPRYHAGGMIGPDEVPAILQRGEGVFTAEQMARMGPAGGTYTFAPTIHFQGDAGNQGDRDALLAGMRSLWVRDIQAAAPGIIEASKTSLRGDVQRQGINRALGAACRS